MMSLATCPTVKHFLATPLESGGDCEGSEIVVILAHKNYRFLTRKGRTSVNTYLAITSVSYTMTAAPVKAVGPQMLLQQKTVTPLCVCVGVGVLVVVDEEM